MISLRDEAPLVGGIGYRVGLAVGSRVRVRALDGLRLRSGLPTALVRSDAVACFIAVNQKFK